MSMDKESSFLQTISTHKGLLSFIEANWCNLNSKHKAIDIMLKVNLLMFEIKIAPALSKGSWTK